MSLYMPNLLIKSPFLWYRDNNFIELLVYYAEVFEAFFQL